MIADVLATFKTNIIAYAKAQAQAQAQNDTQDQVNDDIPNSVEEAISREPPLDWSDAGGTTVSVPSPPPRRETRSRSNVTARTRGPAQESDIGSRSSSPLSEPPVSDHESVAAENPEAEDDPPQRSYKKRPLPVDEPFHEDAVPENPQTKRLSIEGIDPSRPPKQGQTSLQDHIDMFVQLAELMTQFDKDDLTVTFIQSLAKRDEKKMLVVSMESEGKASYNRETGVIAFNCGWKGMLETMITLGWYTTPMVPQQSPAKQVKRELPVRQAKKAARQKTVGGVGVLMESTRAEPPMKAEPVKRPQMPQRGQGGRFLPKATKAPKNSKGDTPGAPTKRSHKKKK
jgi:hypothetical protein